MHVVVLGAGYAGVTLTRKLEEPSHRKPISPSSTNPIPTSSNTRFTA